MDRPAERNPERGQAAFESLLMLLLLAGFFSLAIQSAKDAQKDIAPWRPSQKRHFERGRP